MTPTASRDLALTNGLILLALWSCVPDAPKSSASAPSPIEVAFSPGGHCADLAVNLIGSARQSIRVQAYSFTSKPIATALAEAHKRGVDVQVILDRSNLHETSSEGRALADAGIPVTYDSAHPIAHNKIIVIDGTTTIGGSFNYSVQAARNAENMTILRDAAIARKFADNWTSHRAHSEAAH
jgi:phosphatidylserine/phosphatidylglycerophosphate/cardiolipin synthase-like enzyme